jgi:acetyl-CoA carboxylase biotin carboxyl carrier protein
MTSPLDQIPRLAALLAETGLATMDLSGPSGRVFLSRNASGPAASCAIEGVATAAQLPVAPGRIIPSPGIGLFRLAHPLHERPLAEEGAWVAAGQVLGLLQVGALLRPIRAPCGGTLVAVRRADGTLTGYGDPLFDIHPN